MKERMRKRMEEEEVGSKEREGERGEVIKERTRRREPNNLPDVKFSSFLYCKRCQP